MSNPFFWKKIKKNISISRLLNFPIECKRNSILYNIFSFKFIFCIKHICLTSIIQFMTIQFCSSKITKKSQNTSSKILEDLLKKVFGDHFGIFCFIST